MPFLSRDGGPDRDGRYSLEIVVLLVIYKEDKT